MCRSSAHHNENDAQETKNKDGERISPQNRESTTTEKPDNLPRTPFTSCFVYVSRAGGAVRAEHEFEHGRPAGALNIPAFFSTGQGMQVNTEFVSQASPPV